MAISSTYGTWTVSWPYPQMFYTGDSYIAAAYDNDNISIFELYNSEDQWYAERCTIVIEDSAGGFTFPAVFPATFASDEIAISSIQVAGFGPFYTLSITFPDEEPRCWYRDVDKSIGAGCLVEISDSEDVPRFNSSCNFKGQAVLGGVYSSLSPWNNISQCSVAWSGIGNFKFNPSNQKTAGFLTMPWDDYGDGVVHKVIRSGNVAVVYGDSGRALLVPYSQGSTSGFGLEELTGAGISSPYHVGGDYRSHCFIDTNHDVWLVSGKPDFRKLGYREWMDDLFDSGDQVIVSYSASRKQFFFSDGNRCFVLSEYGMGECNQMVTSVVNYKGTDASFFSTNEDYEFRLQLSSMGFGSSSLKTLESLDFIMDYIKTSGTLTAGADYKYNYNDSYRTGSWIRLNNQGSVAPMITAREFKVKVKGTDYRTVDSFRLKDCNGTFKFSDKRMIRGTYASKDYA